MSEQWKPVSGYEGAYEVSDQGNVRSISRMACGPRHRILKSRNMSLFLSKAGYKRVNLYQNGGRTQKFVHRLVLSSFVGDSNKQCNHIDGVKSNNHIGNLEWVTHSENQLHRYRVLGKGLGEDNPISKLREDEVSSIRNLYAAGGITKTKLAEMYNISRAVIRDIVSRKAWRHVA